MAHEELTCTRSQSREVLLTCFMSCSKFCVSRFSMETRNTPWPRHEGLQWRCDALCSDNDEHVYDGSLPPLLIWNLYGRGERGTRELQRWGRGERDEEHPMNLSCRTAVTSLEIQLRGGLWPFEFDSRIFSTIRCGTLGHETLPSFFTCRKFISRYSRWSNRWREGGK